MSSVRFVYAEGDGEEILIQDRKGHTWGVPIAQVLAMEYVLLAAQRQELDLRIHRLGLSWFAELRNVSNDICYESSGCPSPGGALLELAEKWVGK